MKEKAASCSVAREFRVSRGARDRYDFDDSLFSVHGNVIFADFHATRVFAQRMNEGRDGVNDPARAVSAGDLNAVGIIDELMHLLIARYRQQVKPTVMAEAHRHLEQQLGTEAVDELLARFVDEYPPPAVYRGVITSADYLAGSDESGSNREVALEELLLLWLANQNPAASSLRELFDDEPLRRQPTYGEAVRELQSFFAGQPSPHGQQQSLIDLLRSPMMASPHSLQGQLEFIRRMWGDLLGPQLDRILSSLDFLAEEHKVFFGFGPGPVEVPDFAGLDDEIEAFSPDREWMPELVLLAKNVHVWLAQLSQHHRREINRLDQIPDDELDRLARSGMTGLWLIGVWQRSRASARIKQMMGDGEAVASAYSLDDYRVADNLGGEEAFADLRHRAWQRGIRMATDMVPNHVGIDSKWVVEHPDWFIGSDHSPFPSYSYSGPDLCDDERVGVYLEDHYATRSDAAVAFKRVDHWSGQERYIYHGNDGTSMPWNDTAQLDYRLPKVREAVIQTILHVARLSPIIRFDAAMTLTRRHFQRLWFPQPGTGGDIPSRAEHGMTAQDFEAAMPTEFWREVVDRVAAEAPDTLLLAEAFWLLEGYFVRTLGMHRVYNSAFMNMLRDEENADYRKLISSTLDFDPQILKRYVNFMSNPDERTAVDQFGCEDKYFGVATMMATLPGLPMFGHGQVEGYHEKYGMEFYRPRRQEEPDQGLVERHQRQVFPLLHRRPLFADVERFLLFDFVTEQGGVDENVFAYCNSLGDQRALIFCHNRFADTRGRIRLSTPVLRAEGGQRSTERVELGRGLSLPTHEDRFVVCRDSVAGLEHLYSCRRLWDEGLELELRAYEHRVLLDFRIVADDDTGRFARLDGYLTGRGVASIADAMAELELAPVVESFRRLVDPAMLRRLSAVAADSEDFVAGVNPLDDSHAVVREVLEAIADRLGSEVEVVEVADRVRARLEAVRELGTWTEKGPAAGARLEGEPIDWAPLLLWALCIDLGRMGGSGGAAERSRSWLDDWRLGAVVEQSLAEVGCDDAQARRSLELVKLLISHSRWYEFEGSTPGYLYRFLRRVLRDPAGRAVLGVNRHREVVWFNQESFDELLQWLLRVAAVEMIMISAEDAPEKVGQVATIVARLEDAAQPSGFRVDRLLSALLEARDEEADGESEHRPKDGVGYGDDEA